MRLFTVSLCLCVLFVSCGGENVVKGDSGLPEDVASEVDIDNDSPSENAVESLLPGTWELRTDAVEDGVLRQVFLPDRTWIVSEGEINKESRVGGGRWHYDDLTGQLSFFLLPDSTTEVLLLTEINTQTMAVETVSGNRLTWRKIAEVAPEDLIAP